MTDSRPLNVRERVALALYRALMVVVQPALRSKLRRRGKLEPMYLHAMQERFGDYSGIQGSDGTNAAPAKDADSASTGPTVWVHAVSLGETLAAGPLIVALRERVPGMRLVLTHGTATGREAGAALLRKGDVQVWQPWDTPWACNSFLHRFRPQLGLLVDTEVWPNLVAACVSQGIPLCLVNGRMSERSRRTSALLSWLSGPAYRGLHAVWAQTAKDAQRLQALGAPQPTVSGNLKFDATPSSELVRQGQHWRQRSTRPVVMLAISREGEEAQLLQALRDGGMAAREGVQWLIVPRHPQRFDEVARLILASGWSVSRRSAWGNEPPGADTGCMWLGDSLGEMSLYFSMVHAALLGGSFEPLGGHNLIEAAACACPVVMGPYTYNFAQAAEMSLEAGFNARVGTMREAVDRVVTLVQNENGLSAAGASARAWSQVHRGAVLRTASEVASLLFRKQGVDAL